MARHLALLDDALVRIADGSLRRLVVQIPPRHGKSELIGRYFPPWYLGRFPDRQVMYVSYEAKQARRYGRFARNLLQQHGRSIFDVAVADDSSAADIWSIAGREGAMVTAGAGGPLTGKGAHVLIVDDPIKNAEQAASELYRDSIWEWWLSTAFTRLEPDGAVIIVQTRWHKDDLAGRVQAEQPKENWEVISLPALAEENDVLGRQPGEALWPERLDRTELERIRESQSLYWWLALYQQRPVKHGSIEWPSEYFEGEHLWFRDWPARMLKVATLDPSKGKTQHSDYSAYILAGETDDGHLWVEADLDRRPVGKMLEDGAELCLRFKPIAIGVESNAWQDLLQEPMLAAFSRAGLAEIAIDAIYNQVNKEIRIRRLDPLLRSGRIHFRDTPGTRLLVNQLKEFPLAIHDDGPDALEMAVRLMRHYRSGESI